MYTGVLSDQPTTQDRFGYSKAVDALSQIIRNKNTETPLTIGIFGEWGSGKTSLLKMLQQKVQSKYYKSVWFDAWRYDDKHLIQTALIQTILAQMESAGVKDEAYRDQLQSLNRKFLTLIAAKTIQIGTGGAIDLLEITDDVGKILVPDFQRIRGWNEIEREFADLVRAFVREEGRLVIFIDDLDRCLPENAIQVLEAIKLFLAQENCIFVLGIDKQGIETAISQRYKSSGQLSGVHYLEKIIQIPFHLPMPESKAIESYIKRLSRQLRSGRTLSVIREGLDNNPRRIKRFINALSLLQEIAGNENLDEPVLAKLIVIQLRFPKFYEKFCRKPELLDELLKAQEDNEFSELYTFLRNTRDIRPQNNIWKRYIAITDKIL